MTGVCFVDTNVLVYSRDTGHRAKAELASAWLAACWRPGIGRTSVQVLNEYYHVVTRKLAHPLTAAEARVDIEQLLSWDPMALDAPLLQAAWAVQDRYALSWWDSLIVAAAQRQECGYLLTEDLQDGQDLGGVVVVDPLAH